MGNRATVKKKQCPNPSPEKFCGVVQSPPRWGVCLTIMEEYGMERGGLKIIGEAGHGMATIFYHLQVSCLITPHFFYTEMMTAE